MPCATSCAPWPRATAAAWSWRSSTKPSDRRLAIARILGPKGLRGGLRLEVLTDFPERLEADASVWLDEQPEPVRITAVESGGRTTVVYLEGVETREAAEKLAGRYLEAPAHDLGAGEFYWDDLVGLRVEEPGGAVIGELVEIFRAGGNEVYRVVGEGGERLVPALRRMVHEIDLERRVMVVAPDDAEELR